MPVEIHDAIKHNYRVVLHGLGGIEWGLKAIARQAKTNTQKSEFSMLMFALIANEEIDQKTINNILAIDLGCINCSQRNGYCDIKCARYRHSNTSQHNPTKNWFRFYTQYVHDVCGAEEEYAACLNAYNYDRRPKQTKLEVK